MEFIFFLKKYWLDIMSLIGLIASVFGIYEFIKIRIIKKKIPIYTGPLDNNFAEFVYKNENNVFILDVFLDEERSRKITNWIQEGNVEPHIWFSIAHDDYGTEFGFLKNDPEVHWNARFFDSVHTFGYFKVHSIQGPNQGWMSVILKGVGKEHVKD